MSDEDGLRWTEEEESLFQTLKEDENKLQVGFYEGNRESSKRLSNATMKEEQQEKHSIKNEKDLIEEVMQV